MPSTATLPRRGWGRLDVIFLAIFCVVLVGLAAIAIVVDRVGFNQTRDAIIGDVERDAYQFQQRLASDQGAVILRNVEVRPEEGQLRPTLITNAVRTMWGHDPKDGFFYSEDPGGKACYLRYPSGNGTHFDVCAAWQRRPAANDGEDKGGGLLFVTARFAAPSLTPRPENEKVLTGVDLFHLELANDDGTQRARWVLVFGPPSRAARRDMARDFTAPPDAWQITAYRVVDLSGWTVDADHRQHPDFRTISGSFAGNGPPGSSRFIALKIQTNEVFEDATQWLGGKGPIVRLAYVAAQISPLQAPYAFSTFYEGSGGLADRIGQPLIGIASQYASSGYGERITLSADTPPRDLWTTTNTSVRYTASDSSSNWPRRLWLDSQMQPKPLKATPNFPYTISVSVPMASVFARWNFVAARLAISYAAIAVLMLVFYLLVRGAVLDRLMILARTAETITGSADISLPFQSARDEVGVLSRTITALLVRLKEEGGRREHDEQERVKREYDTLRQIGHHIRSPLQALLALNPEGSEGRQYVERMSRAVTALYGSDTPRDQFRAMYGEAVNVELVEFLSQIASNSERIGVNNVLFYSEAPNASVLVDDGALVDVVTQILNNAQRFRTLDTPIAIRLVVTEDRAVITIENQGAPIPESRLKDIFEYGVSLSPGSRANQGQGLFVAAEFVAKMNGSICARNLAHGVAFDISLPLIRREIPIPA